MGAKRKHFFCQIPGCGREHWALGMCNTHHKQAEKGRLGTAKFYGVPIDPLKLRRSEQLVIKNTPEIKENVNALCALRTGVSVNDVINEALEYYLWAIVQHSKAVHASEEKGETP